MTIDEQSPDDEGGASATEPRGLWVRVSATLADDKDVRRFARSIFAPPEQNGAAPFWMLLAAAEGLLVNVWGEVADHAPDGSLEGIDDEQLEEWARWRGSPGHFASLFRQEFVSDGIIKRWIEFNGKLLEYRERERERWQKRKDKINEGRRKPRTAPAPPSAPLVQSGADAEPLRSAPAATVTVDGNNATAAVGEPDPSDPIRCGKSDSQRAVELTISLNQSIHAMLGDSIEPALPHSGHAIEAAAQIAEMGIEHEWAKRAIYALAQQFKPTAENPTISSIAYFPQRLKRHWQKHIAKTLAAAAPAPQDAASAIEAGDQSPEGSKASESTTGGKVVVASGRQFGKDLKSEAIVIFGRLKNSVRDVYYGPDQKPTPRQDGTGTFAYRKAVADPALLAALSPAALEALKTIGGERSIAAEQDHSWKFAAAYVAHAQQGLSTEPKASSAA